MVDAAEMFRDIEQQSGATAEQRRRLGGDDGAVFEFDGGGVVSALDFPFVGRNGDFSRGGRYFRLVEKQSNFIDFVFVVGSVGHFVGRVVESADDFVVTGLTADFVVADAEPNHVHAHVRRRFIGIFAVDALEKGVENGENLDIAVVIDSGFAIGFQMEWVDHVHIV